MSIGIIATLFTALALVIQPQKQLNKAWDAQRVSDITKIRTAADIYYDNNNCYPQEGEIPFGSEWKDESSGTVYMSKVPQDPENARDAGKAYIYQTGLNPCNQWNVLYGKLTYESAGTTTCPLEQLGNCLPQGYAGSSYNYCVISGTPDCSYLAGSTFTGLPSGGGSPGQPTPTPPPTQGPGGPTPTPIPPGNPTPTPTPAPTPPQCSPPNGTLCNNICVNTQTNFDHCGSCGNSCSSGQTCIGGICRTSGCSLNYSCTSKSQQNPQGTCNKVPDGSGEYCLPNCNGACL